MAGRLVLLIAIGLVFTSPVAVGQPADPLPAGATVRLGTTRMRDLNGWAGAGLTPDGTQLIGYSVQGVTRTDVATGRPVGKPTRLPATGSSAPRAELSADGARAASANYAGGVVWDTATGQTVVKVDRRVPFGEGAVALSADGKVFAIGGAKDEREKDKPVTAVVWDVEGNAKRAEVSVLQNQSVNVALSADGRVLATWGFHSEPNPTGARPDPAKDPGRVVQFWDAATGKELGRARFDGYGAPAVALTPDGSLAAVAASAGTVQIVETKSGVVRRQLFGRVGMGNRVAFSPDARLVAAAGVDGATQLWQTADGKPVAAVESPVGPLSGNVREVRFTAADRAVVFAVLGSAAVMWEVPSGKMLSPTGGHFGPVSGVTFAAGGKEVLTGGLDGAIIRWDTVTGNELGEVVLRSGGHGPTVRHAFAPVVFGPGGAVAVADRVTRAAYDLASGKQLFAVPSGYESRSLLAADARTLVIVPIPPAGPEPPTTIRPTAWDAATGTRLAEFELPFGELQAAVVSPDRRLLVTALVTRPAKDGKAEFVVAGWDLAAGGQKKGQLVLPGGFGNVHMAAAPDNTSVLASTPDGRFVVVDAAAGRLVREIETNRQAVTATPVFAPDGKTFAVGLAGNLGVSLGLVRVYDAETGKPRRTFQGHLGPVTCVAFAPDGNTLASGSADTTVLLWSLDRGG